MFFIALGAKGVRAGFVFALWCSVESLYGGYLHGKGITVVAV
jgi:hypothetical protein